MLRGSIAKVASIVISGLSSQCSFEFVSQYIPSAPSFVPNPSSDTLPVICNNGWYATMYYTPYKMPIWSAYQASPGNVSRIEGGRRDFKLNPQLSSDQQAPVDSDAFNTTYNRGHLCPSYIMSWNKSDNGPWYDTYYMTNVAPQYGSFNQQQWADVERDVIDWIDSTQKPLYIFTGTGFWNFSTAPSKKSYDGVVVPDFYFKAMCQPYDHQSRVIIAANDESASGWDKSLPVSQIEQILGTRLYPPTECNTGEVDINYWSAQYRIEAYLKKLKSSHQHNHLSVKKTQTVDIMYRNKSDYGKGMELVAISKKTQRGYATTHWSSSHSSSPGKCKPRSF